MKQKIAFFILTISCIISAWIYWVSDVKVEQALTSREWQSTMHAYLSPTAKEESIIQSVELSKITVSSNVKYLPNGNYLRESIVEVYNDANETTSRLSISETGHWELSDDYLLINPTEFKDMTTNQSLDAEIGIVKQLFIMDAQQSRRVDIINKKAILLTSLNHGSRILSSN